MEYADEPSTSDDEISENDSYDLSDANEGPDEATQEHPTGAMDVGGQVAGAPNARLQRVMNGNQKAYYEDVSVRPVNPETSAPWQRGDKTAEGLVWVRRIKSWNQFASPEGLEHFKKHTRSYIHMMRREKPVGLLATRMLSGAQQRCKKKGRGTVTITHEWVVRKLQAGRCEYTRLPFVMVTSGSAYSPSLERLDSTNPNYSEDNVAVVCTQANLAVNRWGLAASAEMFQALAAAAQQAAEPQAAQQSVQKAIVDAHQRYGPVTELMDDPMTLVDAATQYEAPPEPKRKPVTILGWLNRAC